MKIKINIKTILCILGIIFFLVGFSFSVIGGVSLYTHRRFINDGETTMAEIVDIDREYYYTNNSSKKNRRKVRYYVDIEYTVDGQNYEQTLNQYSSDMYIGKEIEIYYDPDMPHDVKLENDIFSVVFFSIGIPFTVLGAIFIIVSIVLLANKKKLMKKGDQLSGTIISVYRNMNVRINGRHPFKADVEVINPFDGETYLYSSKNIDEDISYLVGETVTVYVDKMNKRKYYVAMDETISQRMEDNNIHDYR